MTWSEALHYCTDWIDYERVVDGEYQGQPVYDKDGNAHWVSLNCRTMTPQLQSETDSPFAKGLELYRIDR